MLILGISAYYHDSSVSLIDDGKVVFALQEERVSRIKNDDSFPINALKCLLHFKQLKLSDIEYVCFYEKYLNKFNRIIESHTDFFPNSFINFKESIKTWLSNKVFIEEKIKKNLKKIDKSFNKEIFYLPHHYSHTCASFYTSGFKETVFMNIDGVGEYETQTFGFADKNDIKIDEAIKYPNSLGLLYSAFTQYLGFKINSGEYKVMGLAPYGEPKYFDLILKNLINYWGEFEYELNMDYFDFNRNLSTINEKFIELFRGKMRKEKDEITSYHADIAASIQKCLEFIVINQLNHLYNRYDICNLCLAGGVALNCVLINQIYERTNFKNIHIPLSPGDSGASYGAALGLYYNKIKKGSYDYEKLESPYLGPEFYNYEIEESLKNKNLKYKKITDENELINLIVSYLIKRKVIGIFKGRSEFGPRALGARSIISLADGEKTQSRINLKVKFREGFRPFAPSIIHDRGTEVYENYKYEPFMQNVFKVKKDQILLNNFEKKFQTINTNFCKFPATTHVDLTSRVQSVSENISPFYYKIINEVYKQTDMPQILNTSFNIRGEPIVHTPDNAINCYLNTDIDILVINEYVVFEKEHYEQNENQYFKKYLND